VQLAWGDQNQRVESFAAETVDATGAGDAFAAKFLAELLKLSDPVDAAREANRFAAKAVTKMGGRP
jgi:sugar/nucleoside kinase (ribokinase family)